MKSHLNRRQILAGSAALASGVGCSRSPAPGSEPRVSLLRASYDQRLAGDFRRLLGEHRLDLKGRRILLKPNLVEYDPSACINTHPLVVLAALEAFRALGAAEVRIAEGPGHRRATLDLAEAAGYFRTIPDFERLFTDLNLDDVSRVGLPRAARSLRSLYLPKTVLGCDLLVSMPKMKTHHWVGVTLGMKNLFGLVPGAVYGWPKNVLHWAGIDESIVAINSAIPRMFTIVDGIEGMEGNGPIQGRRKPAGVIVAGEDRVAVDATCCRIMGIDPARIGHLRMAQTQGQTMEANVRQIGEPIRSVRTAFELLPEFRSIRL
ncbi:MAG TPA: DUF362 domain-containing protein [Bryobacteraceae bacterium]|nr:DUF362 domain-containing protein [Bryobacteraceae bacterium]